MTKQKFYLICGICGCSDDWEWYHYVEEIFKDYGDPEISEDVHICCGNCNTVHNLSEKANIKNESDI